MATCIIAMAREPSGAPLGPSGVARMVSIPVAFQNVTVSPGHLIGPRIVRGHIQRRLATPGWLHAASNPKVIVASPTTSMAEKLRFMIHPLFLVEPTAGDP